MRRKRRCLGVTRFNVGVSEVFGLGIVATIERTYYDPGRHEITRVERTYRGLNGRRFFRLARALAGIARQRAEQELARES